MIGKLKDSIFIHLKKSISILKNSLQEFPIHSVCVHVRSTYLIHVDSLIFDDTIIFFECSCTVFD